MSSSLLALKKTAAELLASAVLDLFPNVQLYRPYISNITFGYDFILNEPVDEHVLSLIEHKIGVLAKSHCQIHEIEMMRENAAELFRFQGQKVLAEMILEIEDSVVPIVRIDRFHDLATPGFPVDSSLLKYFRLLGTETYTALNPFSEEPYTVVRFEGIACEDQYTLKKVFKRWKEGKKNTSANEIWDSNLFVPCESRVFALPHGAMILEAIKDWVTVFYQQHGFELVSSPDKAFIENLMEGRVQESPFGLSHALLYLLSPLEIEEKPTAWVEFGQLSEIKENYLPTNLLDLGNYHTDQGHLFVSKEQLEVQLISSLHFINKTVKMLVSEFQWVLCSRVSKVPGTGKLWEHCLSLLKKGLDTCEIPYEIEDITELTTGPRVEVRWIDARGKSWKGPYLGVDLLNPTQVKLKQNKSSVYMLELSLLGSWERLIAILMEQRKGLFPFWLAPEQIRILPISEPCNGYASQVKAELKKRGFRVAVDASDEKLGTKVHAAECRGIPCLLILGKEEKEKETVSVRWRHEQKLRNGIGLEELLKELPSPVPTEELKGQLES